MYDCSFENINPPNFESIVNFYIGAYYQPNFQVFFKGYIDEVRIYKRAVSDEEIAELAFIDSDNDGVSDNHDLCPNTPSNTSINNDGCSDFQIGERIIFQDDFSYENSGGWVESSDSWSIIDGQYNVYLSGTNNWASTYITGSDVWTDFIVEFDLIRTGGVDFGFTIKNQFISFRTGWYWDGGNNYYFLNGSVIGNFTLFLDTSYHFRVECIDNNIKLYIKQKQTGDDQYILLYNISTNSNSLITFHGWSGHYGLSNYSIDNVKIIEK